MAFHYSPKIVTDGLVLYFDAANQKSYIGGSLTCTDISKNSNTGSLINGPVYSESNKGSILFDGFDDYILFNKNSEMGNIFTISAIIKLTSNNSFSSIVGSAANGSDNAFIIFNDKIGCFFTEIADVNNYTLLGTTTLNYGIFYHVTVTVNINKVTLYINGVQDATVTLGFNIGSWTEQMVIGKRSRIVDQWYFNGNIANVQIYNRSLTKTEILQNYNSLKSRFGL